MQPYHPFIPNYPPPPLLTRESIIIEGLKTLEQSKNDEQWLKSWIERKKEQKKFSSNQISLSDYRQKLIQHAHLLQQYEQVLKNSNHEIISELKIQIEQSNNFIYDCNIIKNIQKQIHRRKSKRTRLHRQKEKKKLINTKNNLIEQQSLIKKIQDINTILHIIEQLKQLKNIRQQRQQKDNFITNNNDELTEIQNICNAKLLEYKIDQIELYNYLFNNHNQSFYESIDPDAQYFLRAHQNINDLIQIRQAWDQYSSISISSLDDIIPSKWHEPQIPCDSNWTRYIFNKKE